MIFHIEPTGFGGFFCWRDYGAEYAADLSLGLIMSVMGGLYVWAVLVNPTVFAAAMVSLLSGLLLIFFCNGLGSLYFLRPLSLPFFYYSILSVSWGVTANAGSAALLVWAFDGIVVLVLSLFLYLMVFGEGGEDFFVPFFSLILGAIAWLTALMYAASHGNNDYSPTAYYSMRVVTIIALVWTGVCAINFVINTFKNKIDYISILFTCITAVVGFAALLVIRGVATIFNHGFLSIVGILIMFLLIAALSNVISAFAKKKNVRHENVEYGLLIPVFLLIIMYLSSLAGPNSKAELIDEVYRILSASPTAFATQVWTGIGELFRVTNEAILNGFLKLVSSVFNLHISYVHVATLINQITALILTFAAIAAGPKIGGKLQGKKK